MKKKANKKKRNKNIENIEAQKVVKSVYARNVESMDRNRTQVYEHARI